MNNFIRLRVYDENDFLIGNPTYFNTNNIEMYYERSKITNGGQKIENMICFRLVSGKEFSIEKSEFLKEIRNQKINEILK